MFRTYDLFFSITSNRDSQFILLVWQIFCKILRIKCKLFIVSHSEIDEQIEKVNENIERQLQQYCNYMQNDWNIWIFMTKFADNNAISTTTKWSFFFVNKNFHSRMSFSFDFASYTIKRKRLLIVKTKNIIDIMRNILNYVRDHATINDFHQKRFIVVNFEFIKSFIIVDAKFIESIIEIFQVVDEQDSSSNRRRSRRKIVALTLIESIFDWIVLRDEKSKAIYLNSSF